VARFENLGLGEVERGKVPSVPYPLPLGMHVLGLGWPGSGGPDEGIKQEGRPVFGTCCALLELKCETSLTGTCLCVVLGSVLGGGARAVSRCRANSPLGSPAVRK
jgi:hypothetical protein